VLCNDQNGPKVSGIVALVKFGYMLENPVNPWVLVAQAAVTNLKVRKISRKGWYVNTRILRDYTPNTEPIYR
jgi:hypothetical protein